jgi:NADPH2:quinone reductase
MRAIYIQRHGQVADLKVSDVPAPSINAGEVLVQVEASGINPSDVASVQGRFPNSVLPRIVGRDFAGTVVEGPAELIGTEVWGTGGDLGISRDGTHAEYVAIPGQAVSRRPKNLSAEQSAIVGVPFMTAFSALVRLGQIKEGEWVIVSGAAGAVGQAAIQLARAKGARVVALVRDATERWVAKSGEVEAIAQSDQGNLEAVVREASNGKGAGLALNGVGSSIFGAILGALAVGGRQVVYSASGGREFPLDILAFYRNQSVLFGLDTQKLDVTQCAAILNEIAPLFLSGALRPPTVGEQYPLSDAVQAYGRVASGKSGKIVFVMPSGGEDAVAAAIVESNRGSSTGSA